MPNDRPGRDYVARDRAEITAAHRDWLAGDAASPPAPVLTDGPPWSAPPR